MTGELLAVLGDRSDVHSVSLYASQVGEKGRVARIAWRCLCGCEGEGETGQGALEHLREHGIEVTAT